VSTSARPGAASTSGRRLPWANVIKLVLSLGLGGWLIYGMHVGGLPLVPPARVFAQVSWWTVVAYVVLLAIASYFRGVRWRLLLEPIAPVSSGRALNAVLIGSAAVLLLPFRLGETARPYLIARQTRVGVVAALGTVVAERIIDGLVLSLILGAAMIAVPTLHPLPEQVIGLPIPVSAVRGYAWTFLAIFSAAFLVILLIHAARDLGTRILRSVFGVVSTRLATLITTTLERFADGLGFFRHRKLGLRYLLETAVYWLFAVLGYWILGWGCGVVHADQSIMTFGEACAVMGVLGIAAALPGPPGLIGLFQAGAYAAMTMYFPANTVTGAGAAYVFLLYVVQLSFTILTACVGLLLNFLAPARRLDEAA
jgi:uncharacterized protein (TIRG00374 family)